MKMKKTGGPAFPGQIDNGTASIQSFPGMTLRDYFAAKAMQGMLSDINLQELPKEVAQRAYAQRAYQMADAMLIQRDRI